MNDLSLDNWKPLGYTHDGNFYLLSEGRVTCERFNEVVGGRLGDGWSLSFSVTDEEEDE